MKAHITTIVGVLLSAITCGATFLFALHRQFALVEVAASLALGAQLYFLSSSIGDLLDDQERPNRPRLLWAAGIAAGVVLYFFLQRYVRGAGG